MPDTIEARIVAAVYAVTNGCDDYECTTCRRLADEVVRHILETNKEESDA
jgi:hypothetical protein